MSTIQSLFIDEEDSQRAFDAMLTEVLELTGSSFGFIFSMEPSDSENPYLQTLAISNLAWDAQTRSSYASLAPEGMCFTDFNLLFGEAARDGEVVISNYDYDDPRRKGVPDGHPKIDTFLAVPLFRDQQVIGVVGLANRESGYTTDLVERLGPLWGTCAQLVHAHKVNLAKLEADRTVKEALLEKQALIQEIHHRVKNNVQVILSMLSLQEGKLADEGALAALDEAQRRIRVMGRLYENLYRSEHVDRVEMEPFLRTVLQDSIVGSGLDVECIVVSLEVDPISLPIRQAVPCAQILSELISNCGKHAFPDGRRGNILASLKHQGPGQARLSVVDDGVGLPPGFDMHGTGTLGLELVGGLAYQLGGVLEIASERGTRVSVVMQVET